MSTLKDSGVAFSELAETKETYKELTAKMSVPKELQEWAGYMAAKYGPKVKLHQSEYTNWLTALLVVRYGEAVYHWPTEYSERDIQRAARWFHGDKPEGVHYLGGAYSERSILKMGTMALLIALGTFFVDPSLSFALPVIFGTALTDSAEDDMIEGFYRTGQQTIADWATIAYSVGDLVQSATWNDRIFKCVVAGTSSGAEPAFSSVIGSEVTDSGSVTWVTCAVGPVQQPIFIALYTAAPGEAGGGTEVTGGAYARTAHQPLDANWTAGSGSDGQTDNASDITFPAPSGANWGTVISFAQVDRATGTATMFSYASLTASRVINDGDQAPKFATGALTATWA